MRFLREFMACCGSCSSTSMVKEEARLLVASAPPPGSETCGIRGRKRGRATGTGRSGRNSSSGGEWRPSLSSICEDNVLHERNKIDHHRHHHNHQEVPITVLQSSSSSPSSSSPSSERSLKRKITSAARPRSHCPREDVRRPAVHAVMPTFSPAPFMF
ncbi:uncharacterized protein [Coffea arabica]|nr:uncharacterized protein LOC113688869 isoform X2 [Coffea arabica]XP_027065009.1 uncharacterized protein LOC113691037 isoform X2 [Coffea arabica]